jgi:hypothetical protein
MKVLNLCCSAQHHFEGWFASEADYATQLEKNLVGCPLCGNTDVQRLPSAPHVLTSSTRATAPAQETGGGGALAPRSSTSASSQTLPAGAAQADPQALQQAWMQAVQHVIANTDDVGGQFAEEARRMHYGEAKERPIRGEATVDEAAALRDEGIEIAVLPLPAAMKGSIQ